MRTLVLVLLLAACEEPGPVVTALDPASRPVGQAGRATIHGRNLRPTYNATLDDERPLQAVLGGVALTVVEINAEGSQVQVDIPALEAPGVHDLLVTTENGESVLRSAYRVTP